MARRKTPYRTIGLRQHDYQKLSEIKQEYEADQGKEADWGDFLLFLGAAYLLGKGMRKQTRRSGSKSKKRGNRRRK